MTPLELLTLIGTIGGIITFVVSSFTWLLPRYKYIGYYIAVKIFNRYQFSLDLFSIFKYNNPPTTMITYSNFKEIEKVLDKNTISVVKRFNRPESMKFAIKENENPFQFVVTVRLDEELDFTTTDIEEPKILHYNLVINFLANTRFVWSDLSILQRYTTYFKQIEDYFNSTFFKNDSIKQKYFVCSLFRPVKAKREKKTYNEKEGNLQIIVSKKKIKIKGTNLGFLVPMIKKYYLKRI